MTAKPAMPDDEIIDFGLPPGLHKMTKAEFDAFIQEGLDELERGETIPHEEVVAWIRAEFIRP